MRSTTLVVLLPLLAGAGPLYGGTPQSRPVVGTMSNTFLAKSIKVRATNEGFKIRQVGPESDWSLPRQGDGLPLKKLSRPTLLALNTILDLKIDKAVRFTEFDLLVDGVNGDVPVTVWLQGDHLVVQEGQPVTPFAPMDASTFANKWPGLSLEDMDAQWSPDLIGRVDAALRTMPRDDVYALTGLRLVRRQARAAKASKFNVWTPPDDHKKGQIWQLSAQYILARDGARVEVYDNAIRGEATTFVGTVDVPHSALTHTLVHEFAHAVARLEVPEDNGISKLAVAYDIARDGVEGPSEYGKSNPEEGFAEAYALWCLDKPALKRVQPGVYAWLEDQQRDQAASD